MSIGKCFECDQKAVINHHVIPEQLGGTKTVPLCSDCHGKVHDKDLTSMKVLRDQSIIDRFNKGIYCWGRPPLGYKYAGKNPNKYVVIDPETMVVVQFLFENYRKTRQKYYTIRGLQKQVLEKFGIKLSPQGVRDVLTNDFYIGTLSYGNRPKRKGIHETFITKHRFTRTQNKLKNSRKRLTN